MEEVEEGGRDSPMVVREGETDSQECRAGVWLGHSTGWSGHLFASCEPQVRDKGTMCQTAEWPAGWRGLMNAGSLAPETQHCGVGRGESTSAHPRSPLTAAWAGGGGCGLGRRWAACHGGKAKKGL